MKYEFTAKFPHDGDDAALARRLAAVFRKPLFRGAVLAPRSAKLPATRAAIAALIVPKPSLDLSIFHWQAERHGKPVAGRATVLKQFGGEPSEFTSNFQFRFTLSDGYRDGPFRSADEVRDAAVAWTAAGPALIGAVECGDEGQNRWDEKYELFRRIDDLRVPVVFEWVTVLREDVVANLGGDLRRAERVPGVRVGRRGAYWWIVLRPEPFRFADPAHAATAEQVARALDLAAAQKRFPRSR